MKKLGNLKINPEKVMNNEELINLKGGYTGPCCSCKDSSGTTLGFIVGTSLYDCPNDCRILYPTATSAQWYCG